MWDLLTNSIKGRNGRDEPLFSSTTADSPAAAAFIMHDDTSNYACPAAVRARYRQTFAERHTRRHWGDQFAGARHIYTS